MKSIVFAVLAASLLGACGTTSFGERLQSEGAALSSLGNQWEQGEAMVKRGNALIDKGNKRIADGREMVEDGEDLLRRGRELKAGAESEYRNQQ